MALLAASIDPSAQATNPGGATGAALWVKADLGLTVNGTGQVQEWNDQSGSGNTTTQLRASLPAQTNVITPSAAIVRVANGINFNPAVDFSGASGRSLKGNGTADWNAAPLSIFAVAVPEGAQTYAGVFTAAGNFTADVAGNAGIGLVTPSGSSYALDGTGCTVAISTSSVALPNVVRAVYTTGANGLGGSTWLNGVQQATGTSCATAATTLFEVGGRTGGSTTYDSRIFNGKIAEVVVFRSAVTAANANNIESYLALKYGITLRQTPAKNYTDSGSAIIWNAATNATYNNNIAGIGRDDGSALNQKQSKSVNSDAIVAIGLGSIAADNPSNPNTFAADKTFLIWGRDAGAATLTVPVTGTPLTSLQTIWKAQETGDSGTVLVRVPANVVPGATPMLLRSVDSTFAIGDTQVPLVLNGANYEATIDFADGDFFTFASDPPIAPGGVAAGVGYWIRPEEMVVTGTTITNWDDVYAQHTNEQMLPSGFVYQPLGFNFNPAATDVSDHYIRFQNQQLLAGAAAGEIFYMVQSSGTHTIAKGYVSEFGGGGSTASWQYDGSDSNVHSGWGSTVQKSWNPLTAPAGGPTRDVLQPHLYNVLSKPAEWTARFDGVTNFTTASNVVNFNTSNSGHTYVGASHNSVFRGRFSEVIVYSRDLTAFERQRVNSYVATKYGVTLGTTASPIDYLASDGTVYWTGSATYQNNVAAIGRDDASGLAQRQSTSVHAGDIVTIGLGAIAVDNATNPNNFTADKSFLAWGRDAGTTSFNVGVIGTDLRRMGRIWRAQELGTVGSVVVRVPVSNFLGQAPVLIRSTDTTFDGTDPQVSLVLNGTDYEATTDFAANEFFTFAAMLPSPGGISGPALWLRGDLGVTLAGANASTWFDQSGNTKNAAQVTVANQPLFQSSPVNFNPGLSFAGPDVMSGPSLLGTGAYSNANVYIVSRKEVGGSHPDFLEIGAGVGGRLATYQPAADNLMYWDAGFNGGAHRLTAPAGSIVLNQFELKSYTASTTLGQPIAAVRQAISKNGKVLTSDTTMASYTGNNGVYGVGGNPAGSDGSETIAEVIAYTSALTLAQHQQIQSYLALKYGITLDQTAPQNYLASDATVIWNGTINAAHKNNIAGIGRDDGSALAQKQSQSINTASSGNLVTIGLGAIALDNLSNANAFGADRNFLVWGDNGGAIFLSTIVPGTGGGKRMTRVWRAQETGTVGAVQVRVPLSALPGTGQVLIRSTDATFASGNTIIAMVGGASGFEATTDFADGEFFTFAALPPAAPGGIGGGLALWLKADAGTPVNGSNNFVNNSGWLDQSGSARHANLVFSDPQKIAGAVNFNPTVRFDGNDYMRFGTSPFASAFTAGEVFSVTKENGVVGTTNGSPWDFGGGSNSHYTWSNEVIYLDFGTSVRFAWHPVTKAIVENKGGAIAAVTGPSVDTSLFHIFASHSAPGDWGVNFDGANVASTATHTVSFVMAGGNEYIGATSGGLFNGDVPEVFLYNRALTTVERQQVNSYLAVKYGITQLAPGAGAQDYLSSLPATTWNGVANSAYHIDVAGIGRDDASALLQKQSASINAGNVLTIGLGTIAADNQSNATPFESDQSFLIWGRDTGALSQTVAIAPTNYNRVARIWRAQETGTVGNVVVRVPTSLLTGTLPVLIRSADATFTDTDTFVPMAQNGANYEAAVDFAGVEFFTFGSVLARPGGVGGEALWLRADVGLNCTIDNCTATLWEDQSGNGKDAATTAGTLSRKNVGVNFNPVLGFDTAEGMRGPSLLGAATRTDGSIYIVSKKTTIGGGTDFYEYNSTAVGDGFGVFQPYVDSIVYWDAGMNDLALRRLTAPAGTIALGQFELKSYNANNVGGLIFGGTIKQSIATNGKRITSDATMASYTGGNKPYQLGGITLSTAGAPIAAAEGVEDFAEVIVYTSPINAAQHQAIESYLALKYGITLDQTTARNYVDSGAAVIWNGTTNSGYKTNIAGIGRDDTSGLAQRQSKSINAGEFVTIGLGSVALDNVSNPNNFDVDKTFMTWGHDNTSQVWGLAIPGSTLKRMPRVWKVQETGTVGSVVAQMPRTILGGITPMLFRSDDATFDSTDTQVPMTVNGGYLEATIDFATGDYFTFASENGPAVRQFGDGYLTDGTINGAIPGAITPTCYPTQFWEHVPIEQRGVFTGGNLGYMHGGFTQAESTILADVNNDGKLDILAIFDTSGTWAWLGNGDGTFQTAAIADLGTWLGGAGGGNGNSSTHVGDVNGDGNVDIAFFYDGLGSAAGDGTWVWLGNGDGTFQHTPIQQPTMSGGAGFAYFPAGGYTANESTDLVDTNNDGKLDIVWVYDAGVAAASGTRVWLGNGDGTWQAAPILSTGLAGGTGFTFSAAGGVTANESTHLVDIDKDGLVDLVWLYDAGVTANSGVRWWKGNGNGTFQTTVNQDLGFAGGPGLAFGAQGGQTGNETTRIVDVNRDGNLDIVWIYDAGGAPANSGTYVYLGNGNGTFNHTPTLDVGAFSNTPMLGAAYIQAGFSPSESTLVGDLNGDSVPDILWTSELNGVANSGTLVWLGKDTDKDDLADIVDPDDDNDGVLDASDTCDSPGSVSPSMALWLKADEGATVDGSSNFIHWADQTAFNRDGNLVAGDPQRIDAGVNFNPTVRFDGNDWFQFGRSPFVTGFTAAEAFTVLKSNQAAGATNGNPYDFGSGARSSVYIWSDGSIYNGFGSSDRLGWNPVSKAIVDPKVGVSAIAGPSIGTTQYHLYQTHSATNDWGTRFDGTVVASTTTNAISFALIGGNEHVGATSGAPFAGDVAEVILYNRTLTASERNQVESYLGTKYGITIAHSYLASDDTTIYWDMTANAAYHNDVAGIGFDTNATLNQKQSGSINPGNIVSIGLDTIEATNQLNPSTFAADKTFMMWGHDNGAVGPTAFVLGTSPKLTRLGRAWKVQETLTVGVVNVRVPQSALAGTSPVMIRSTDATFTSTDELLPMSPNGTDYEVTIDYANGDFFTFASFLPAPGGVAGPGLWVKANDGPSDTVDGNAIATWSDRSGNSKDLSVLQAAAAVQPTFDATSLNFNPAVNVLNTATSDQGLWNQNFLGTTNGSYNLDASMFFAHTSHKAANCNGLADFSSPIDGASNDHPWMGGGCPALGDQLAAYNFFSTPVLVQSGAGMTAPPNVPALHGFTWRYNVSGSFSFRQNGAVAAPAAFAPGHAGRDFYLLRDNSDNNNDGSDEMNEAIMYPRQLTAAENQRVESYLAIKYGVTLRSSSNGPQDYLNSATTTIWSGIANPTYHNAVAGIMADSGSALDQRVSQSVNPGAQIAIAAGAFDFSGIIGAQSPTETIGDESSVVWGDNNGATVINIPVANTPGIEARMARIWRDQITGTGVPGQLSIRVPATMVETGNPTLRTPVVLIDDEATFDNARIVPLTPVAGYYTATFTTFSATESFFTIAGATSSVNLSKAFAPTPLAVGGTTRLTLTLTNVSPVTQSALAFTDTLPSGLVVAAVPNEVTTCAPGTVSAAGSVVSLANGEVAASQTCTVEVDVTTAPAVIAPITCPAASVTNGSGNITGLSANLTLASGFGACVNVVLSSDVSIAKAAPVTFVAGSTVAYTLTVTNNGPSPATAVTVTDVLPAQLTFVPAGSTPSCSAVGQNVTCALGTVPANVPQVVTLNVQVAANLPAGTVVSNTASVTTTSPDPNGGNNASTVASPPAAGDADLSIVKSTLEASVTPGNTFTYQLVITNAGPSTASNVTASDTLPAEVTFVSSLAGCTVAGQLVSCGPVATLAPSASTTFDIVVRLDPAYTGTGAAITNVATTTSDTFDPDPANNTSATVAAPTVNAPSADLSTTKVAVEPSVAPGETFTYRITVTNNGPSTAVDVGVTDTLPAQLAFVSSPTGCTAIGQDVTCGPVATLAPTQSTIFDIVVRLDPAYVGTGAGITNTATATSPTVDPDPTDNISPPAPLPTVTAPKADMQIVKSLDDPTGIVPGDNYDYTLTIQNNGPSFAQGVTVTDPLPPYVVFVSGPANCVWNPLPAGSAPGAGGTVTCTSAANPTTIGVPESFAFTVQLHPDYALSTPPADGANQQNSAAVGATTVDPTMANNTSPAGAPPVGAGEADIALVKTTSIAPVAPGETFTYTLLVSNQGPSTASDVTVTDTLPPFVTFQSGTDCVAVGQDVTCTLPLPGTLTPGQSRSFVLTVLLAPAFIGTCDDIRNTATAQSSTTDPIPGNNTYPVPPALGICPPLAANEADVSITKTASVAPVVPGTTFTYTLAVTNNGPSDAQGVSVSDILPTGLTFVSSPNGCTAFGQTVTCPTSPIGTLPLATPTASFEIVVMLDPSYVGTGTDILNVATVATTSVDPNTTNNTSAASSPTAAAPSANVSLAKTILEPVVVPGGQFTYSVTVSNAGPSTAATIQVTDTLPAGVTFVSSTTGCTAAAGTVTCPTVTSLAPAAAPVNFQFTVSLDPAYVGNGSDLPNVATATSFTPDPDSTNNSNPPVFPNVGAASADISITKIAVEPSVVPGNTFSYTIVVANAGTSVAMNSVVTDTLPANLAFVSSTAGCTAAGQVVTCPAIPSIAVGGSSTFTLVVRLDPAYTGTGSDLGNVASVLADTADPNLPNNTSASAASPTVLAASADVRIVKNVSGAAVAPGETFTYTLTLTNAGPSVSRTVFATDTLPSQVTFGSSSDGCTAAGASVMCPSVAVLSVGASATFTFVVQLDPSYSGNGSDILNSSLVQASTADPALANNSSPAGAPPVGPGNADLAIRKDVSTAPVTPGTSFSYTLTVSNLGPSTATDIVVTDTLPGTVSTGVHFVSSPDGCSAVDQVVTCPTTASMVPGASATFMLVVQLDPSYAGNGSDISNTATVTSPTTDPVPANNTSNPATPVVGTASADVSVTKSVVEPQALPGENFTYRITVSNAGPSTALGVQIVDALPAEVTFVSSPSGCTAGGQHTVSCPPIGSLAVGVTMTYDIVVTLDSAYTGDGSDVINSVEATAATPDPSPANNTGTTDIPDVGAGNSNVSITKGVITTPIVPGSPLTYRLTVSNAGPASATSIAVSDTLPSQVTFVSSPSGCTAGTPVTCPSIATLASGASATFDIVVILNPSYVGDGSNVLNTATAFPTTNDPDLTDNTATNVPLPGVSAPSADLSITKVTLEPSVVPGGTFTYSITVTNAGPSTAANSLVSDPLPIGLTFVSSASCAAAGQNVTCAGGVLLPGDNQNFQFVVRLDPGYAGTGSDLGNVATVSSTTGDPELTNNSNTATPTPPIAPPTADLSITKTAVEPSVTPGENFSYLIVVSNAGPSTATDIVVSDALPAGLTFVSSTAGCTAVGQDVTCPAIVTLAPGATSPLTLVVRLDPAYTGNGSDLDNTATATSPTDPTDPTSLPTPPPTINAPSADVRIVKSVSTGTVLPGQQFGYAFTITNAGPSTAVNVEVTDTLPVETTFVSSADGCTATGQSVTCPTLPALAPGATQTFNIVVLLDSGYVGTGGDILNSAIVASPTADPAMANNTSPAGAPPVGPGNADLAITKDVSATPVTPGTTFSYVLTVSNQGPSDANLVEVADTLPALVTFVSSPDGCTAIAQDVTCTLATLAAGSSATFTLVVELDASYGGNGNDIQNTASVSSATTDPNLPNNTSNPATPVIGTASSDVSIAKSVLPGPVVPGGTLTYRIVVSNGGPSTALGVAVTDALPVQVTFVSSPSFCNATGQSVVCPPIGSLAVGATATFDVVVRLDPSYTGIGNDVLNIATVTTTTPDPDPTDNETPPVPLPAVSAADADVSITKAVVEPLVTPGESFTYRLTVANAGPATAVNVVVMDTLPSAVTFASSVDGCTAAGQLVTCPAIPSLLPGTTQTIDLVVELDPAYLGTGSTVLNTASAQATTADGTPGNNTVTLVAPPAVGPPSADLRTAKITLEPSVTAGETFTYRVSVTNDGPSTATNVVVTDLLPTGLTFVSSTSGCTAAGQLVTCPAVPALGPGLVSLVEFVVLLDPGYLGDGSDLGNQATATSTTPDPDPTDNINPPTLPPTLNAPSADVQIVKSVSGATVAPGDTYTYTLTITNHGPSKAVNVAVTDTLPTQTTFVSSSAGCTALGQSVTCPSIASMAVGATQSFDIGVQLDASYVGNGSDVLNVAIALAQTSDPFLANNSSRLGAAPVGGPNADLAIVKDVSTDPVTPGTNFFYRLTVANQGPSTATNVVVTDPLPVGVNFVSSPELCTAVGQDVTCPPVASLLPGQAATFVLVVQLDPSYGTTGPGNGSDIQNVASVTSDASDPVLTNNTSNPATPVVGTPNSDVSVAKSVVEPSVAPGGIFTYRLVVTNVGPSTALGVVVTDPLPTQVSFVSSPQGCTAAGQNVTCPPLGSLAVGASVTFDIRVLLDPLYAGDGSDVINIATSTSSTPDSVPANDTSAPIALAVIPTGVDIVVTLAASPLNTVTGDVITLTATVRNAGPDDATGLTLSLPLSIDVNTEGLVASVGSYDPTTGVWTIGALPAGTAVTLQLSLRAVARGTPTLTATVTHVDQIDRNAANNAASVALYMSGWSIPHADLVIDGTTNPAVIPAGGVLTYTLHGINRGPAYVVDLFLSGAVPAGTTFASVVPSTGAVCTAPPVGGTGTVTCTWPGVTFVDVGAQRTMAVSVAVAAGAAPGTSLAGSFLVSSLNPEYYLPSNLLTLTTSVADGSSGIADLAVTAIMQSDGVTGTALALPLGVATPMRFTVRNNGPTPTAGATYAIEIPAEDLGYLQILGASLSQGAVALTGISAAEWQVGPLASGATATFDLTVAMQHMRATTIAMRRTGSAPADPNNANDRATLILDGTGHPEAGERFTAIGNINGVGTKEVLVGAGRLETPQVRIYDGSGADTGLHFLAYSRAFVGGVRLASCDVDGDGIDEIITAPGIGPGPHLRVLRMQGNVVRELVGFYAFDPSFPGGVYVSCADVDGDGRGDVVASMGEGGSEVRVFGVGLDFLTTKAAFTAYESGFTGGARIAAVGTTEPGGTQYQIVTVSGPGRPLEVRTWAVGGGAATLVRSLPLTGAEYQLGAFIDVADLNGDGSPEAVLATDRGIPSLIGVVTLDTSQVMGIFQAFPSTFLGGSRVSLGDIDNNGRMELLVSPGYGGRPVVDAYTIFGGTANFVVRLHPIELP